MDSSHLLKVSIAQHKATLS